MFHLNKSEEKRLLVCYKFKNFPFKQKLCKIPMSEVFLFAKSLLVPSVCMVDM